MSPPFFHIKEDAECKGAITEGIAHTTHPVGRNIVPMMLSVAARIGRPLLSINIWPSGLRLYLLSEFNAIRLAYDHLCKSIAQLLQIVIDGQYFIIDLGEVEAEVPAKLAGFDHRSIHQCLHALFSISAELTVVPVYPVDGAMATPGIRPLVVFFLK